ncbi:MAG TPA: glycosyltransferase family 2 protein [Xanthobacteraceae bacterium]|nr:glycosyltransferase family 2 protein [Xanthobacteraceae bacterium]
MRGAEGVTVVIPTFNEAESIGTVVAELACNVVARIIVADGGSSDRTQDIARAAGAEVIAVGRGYGLACLAGAQAAGADDIIVFMDGDGADDASVVAALITPIRRGDCDFVITSRARGEREPGSMAWHQVLAGHAAGILTRLLYGVRYTDMSAFRAIRRETLLGLGMRELTYGWNLEMQMRVARAGLRVLELPVVYRRRLGGESKVAGSLRGSLKAGIRIMSTFARVAAEPMFRRVL